MQSVTIAIPVLNEEAVLRDAIEKICAAAAGLAGYAVTLVIADNGSHDGTERIGRELAVAHAEVKYLRLAERGKGRAIRAAWQAHPADINAFMDADLSTDLGALPALIGAVSAGADVAVGSRRHRESKVVRTPLRRLTSRGYGAVLRSFIGTRIADVPCGFKAVSARVIREVLPTVDDQGWFFDSELVLRAERRGFAVREVPVVWRDDRDRPRKSKVDVFRLAGEYVKRAWRLRRAMNAR
ncbi:glycosyltransferase [Candidatus Uhrbacteria bacterium]|nr:glycosyltransferase [Candidatus Uhrbacteria bacterium]